MIFEGIGFHCCQQSCASEEEVTRALEWATLLARAVQ
jgi:hypothetical protein